MPILKNYDYCENCPYFEVSVLNCNTPEDWVSLMNKEETEVTCQHAAICDRLCQYVRERCKQC